MRVLYITYIDFDDSGASGSSMRPKKMYNAFINQGYDVKLLECQQNRSRERKRKVCEVLKWLENNTADFCYIESPSGPIFHKADLNLIKKVHEMNIPIGYFCRDAFWLFKDKMRDVPFFKRNAIIWLNKRAIKTIRENVDIVYLPTESGIELFNFAHFKRMGLLPPASECNLNSNGAIQRKCQHTCIYVGAVSEVDGTFDLLHAFKLLNSTMQHEKYRLILVARQAEWKKICDEFDEPIDNNEWLSVYHTSQDELANLYNRSDIAIIPRKANKYIDISMPIKLFEYMGYGKPIISTERLETAKIIRKYKCGIICEDGVDGLVNAIKAFYADAQLRDELYRNVQIAARENRWESRVEKVTNDLL